jgi:2'-5' RNA ligase
VFLTSTSQVVPTQRRDYPEWHHGREHFALWYIELQDPNLILYLNQVRDYFSDFLLLPNKRQFHITLFVCGFLAKEGVSRDDDFTFAQFQQQQAQLKLQQPSSFKLKIAQVNSFHSALFLEVQDPDGILSAIRTQCAQFSDEVAALTYCPHITLGLYNAAFPSQTILDKIASFKSQAFEIEITQLNFGYYQAQVLQGPLYSLQTVTLGEVCCN